MNEEIPIGEPKPAVGTAIFIDDLGHWEPAMPMQKLTQLLQSEFDRHVYSYRRGCTGCYMAAVAIRQLAEKLDIKLTGIDQLELGRESMLGKVAESWKNISQIMPKNENRSHE